jgi:hypothetical protein
MEDHSATAELLLKSIFARHAGCLEVWDRIKEHKKGDNFVVHGITLISFTGTTLKFTYGEKKIAFVSLKTHFAKVMNIFKDELPDQVRTLSKLASQRYPLSLSSLTIMLTLFRSTRSLRTYWTSTTTSTPPSQGYSMRSGPGRAL